MNKYIRLLKFAALVCSLISAGSILAEEPDMEEHKREPTPFVKGSWTVVVLPDTQKYTLADSTAPTIVSAEAFSPTQVSVTFSEPLETTSAETASPSSRPFRTGSSYAQSLDLWRSERYGSVRVDERGGGEEVSR